MKFKTPFSPNPPSLAPAIQKYDAIDSIIKAGAIVINCDKSHAVILQQLWDIYPEKKQRDVLSNLLFYINFSNAAENKKHDHFRLTFEVKGTTISGTYTEGNKAGKGTIRLNDDTPGTDM